MDQPSLTDTGRQKKRVRALDGAACSRFWCVKPQSSRGSN